MPESDVTGWHGTHGAVLSAVSDGMVAMLKEFYGLGPAQAKSYYYDDLVVCVMRGGFTKDALSHVSRTPSVTHRRVVPFRRST